MTARLGDLDDPDYPAYTTGRAAEVLGVQQAFLRALDTAGAVTPQRTAGGGGGGARRRGGRQASLLALDAGGPVPPQRTAGGRRRYTRRQLVFAARIRELFDQGHTLAAALRILALEDDLATERALTARLHERLAVQDQQDKP